MRRILVDHVHVGKIALPRDQAHHARDVLRMESGDEVEVFDPAGVSAFAKLILENENVFAQVDQLNAAAENVLIITVAAAVPKGDRADWMVEKLSELGVTRYIPLRTARSIVHPAGNKLDRWRRIAAESAKQCKRTGVMTIDELTPVEKVIAGTTTGCCLSTQPDATPALTAIRQFRSAREVILLIGPEGDWTNEELATMQQRGFAMVSLGRTILRVETAAIAAAVLLANLETVQ